MKGFAWRGVVGVDLWFLAEYGSQNCILVCADDIISYVGDYLVFVGFKFKILLFKEEFWSDSSIFENFVLLCRVQVHIEFNFAEYNMYNTLILQSMGFEMS